MRTLECFVIMPSGRNPAMRLAPDVKHGLGVVPSNCTSPVTGEISVDFQVVYDNIIFAAIKQVNAANKVQIRCMRGEDLPQGGNIVSQFLQNICRADITITDLTGLNPNVLLEYGIRLSVKDSLNLVLCHRGTILPRDIGDQRWIDYALDLSGAKQTQDEIVRAIQHGLPTLLKKQPETVDNLFRRTVENETGRKLERQLAQVFDSTPHLVGDLINELQRLDELGKMAGDASRRADPNLRHRAWSFVERLGRTLAKDRNGRERMIELYLSLTKHAGFSYKRSDLFYQLSEICAEDPNRLAEAQLYREQVKASDSYK